MIQIPDLTRVSKQIGKASPDLKIDDAIYHLFHNNWDSMHKYSARYGPNWGQFMNRILNDGILPYFDQDNAVYRRDFIGELIDNEGVKASLIGVYDQLPHYLLNLKDTKNYGGAHYERQVKLTTFLRFLGLAKTMEMLAEIPGNGEAWKELRQFAVQARKELSQFEDGIKKLREKPDIAHGCANEEWVKRCIRVLAESEDALVNISGIINPIEYYLEIASMYDTVDIDYNKIPRCRPEYLDPGERRGIFKEAYHPGYFKGSEIAASTRLNVPNDIEWGEKARYLFIRGAHSGGKTVYINAIGLNLHMAMAGLYPFATSCELSLPDRVFTCLDLGDNERAGSFEPGARRIDELVGNIGLDSIALLDEVGKGTRPDTEYLIARQLTEELMMRGITFFDIAHDEKVWQGRKSKGGVRMLRAAEIDKGEDNYKILIDPEEIDYSMDTARKFRVDPESMHRRFEERFGDLKTSDS